MSITDDWTEAERTEALEWAELALHVAAGAPAGPVLRGWRERRGLTQAEVARRLRVSQARVSQIEATANPTVGTVRDYATAVRGDEHPPP